MTRRRLLLIGLVAILQAAVVLAMALRQEVRLAEGRTVLLDVRPVDPRDPLRGDYVTLRYAIQQLPHALPVAEGVAPGDEAWLLLRVGPDGRGAPLRVVATRPDALADDLLPLRVRWEQTAAAPDQTHRLSLPGLDRYFVPQGSGEALEAAIRTGDVQARLRVSPEDGQALLEALLVDSRVWTADP